MIAALLLVAQVAAPTPEAEALGQRLARLGTLATLGPLQAQADIAELQRDPALTPADRARVAAIGEREMKAEVDRVMAALGRAYAARLTVADLRTLIAQAESPAAARRRAIEPSLIVETMQSVGSIDLKKTVAAAVCAETKKLCARE